MEGSAVKRKLLENGYKLKDVANSMGIQPQNLQILLSVKDIKTGVLEDIAKAINKDLYFFLNNKEDSKIKTKEVLKNEFLSGEDLKEIRKKYGITQTKLAEIAGVGLLTVKSWEYTQRNISKSSLKLINKYIEEQESIYKNKPSKVRESSNIQKDTKNIEFSGLSIEDKLNTIMKEMKEMEIKNKGYLQQIYSVISKIILKQKVFYEYIEVLNQVEDDKEVIKTVYNNKELKEQEEEIIRFMQSLEAIEAKKS